MDQNESVSMVEPEHEVQAEEIAAEAPIKRRNIMPFIVIGVSAVLLIILTVVLLILVKNGGDVYGYHYSVDYKKNFLCATDEYNYYDGVFDIEFGLKEDGTYKMGIVDYQYSIGTFKEMNQTYAKSADGANEINYYLSLKLNKTYMDNDDITEEPGKEETYILNINENSDVVVLMTENEETVYYCNVKE